MAPVAMGLGIVLIILGVGGYFGTGQTSLTALIPAYFGLGFLLLGLLAQKELWRKHAMHLAAMLGVLGVIGGALRPVRKLMAGETVEMTTPVLLQLTMIVLCAVFVGLCVRSFIAARRARQLTKRD